MALNIFVVCVVYLSFASLASTLRFTEKQKHHYRNKVKLMFYHAYNSYLNYAYPLDELKPLSCSGMDTWGSFSLTLIDSLDTLLIMGNETEFVRASKLILDSIKVDSNVNVSVFETNIRVVGGLLTAHLLSGRVAAIPQEPGWPCSGPLLRLAERFAQKLLPAFNTDTGMPYGTVNLKYGVHKYETPVTCTAGVGTMILELGTLSKLTGNPHYERVAQRALDALWNSRSSLGLVGNHINVQSGEWTATDAGIGAGIDSYFEYLAKGALLFQRPKLMQQFNEYVALVNKYVRKEDWFVWVSMVKGQVSLPIFQSLEAFWPGILALTGKVADAQRILMQYSQIIRQYGFPPEFYNLPNQEAVKRRSGYPLRPEFIESIYYVYRATKDPWLLQLAADITEAIDFSCRTSCGFATIENVNDHSTEDRMESFFLSETTKYLYLIFDEDNFINNGGSHSREVETPNGLCVLDVGGYIFNTEAHPLDPAALYCCSTKRNSDLKLIYNFENQINFIDLIDISDSRHEVPSSSNNYKNSIDVRESSELQKRNLAFGREIRNFTTSSNSNSTEVRFMVAHTLQPNAKTYIKSEGASRLALKRSGRKYSRSIDALLLFHQHDTNLTKRKAFKQLSFSTPVAVCQNCCRLIDYPGEFDSLHQLLAIFYRNFIYPRLEVKFINGPACLEAEFLSQTNPYSKIIPDTSVLNVQDVEDAVDGINLNWFRYRMVSDQEYDSLLTSPQPFISYFTGVGQVLPLNFSLLPQQ